MGWRFRKSFKILPGVRWNLGKRGSSLSLGGRGVTVNVSKRGTRTTLGIPGTGLSYSTSTKHSANPPPLPPNMPKGKRSGKWFYIVAGVFGFVWLIGLISNSETNRTSRTATPDVADVPAASEPTATPAPAPTAVPTPEVRKALAVPIARAQAVTQSSERPDNYTPDSLILTADVSFPVRTGAVQTGLRGVRKGTRVKLYKISGTSVIVQYEGMAAAIPAYQTDLLDRMTGQVSD